MGALTNFWEWITGNPVARQIGVILLAIFGAFAGYKIWKANVENGVRRQEREEFARRSAEASAEITATITENSLEYVRASERVRSHTSASVLPDGTVQLGPENYRD